MDTEKFEEWRRAEPVICCRRPENKEVLKSTNSPILEGVELRRVVIRYRFKSGDGGILDGKKTEKKTKLSGLSAEYLAYFFSPN